MKVFIDIYNKHLTTGPKGNNEFLLYTYYKILNVLHGEAEQNSLFPVGPVILKVFCYSPNSRTIQGCVSF